MPGDDDSIKKGIGEVSQYEEALDALSSLITNRDKYNKGDCFESMYDYVKILDLDEDIARTKIIHVAGTKGKGSTCAFTESILRHCGLRTGLFTSPHLIDIRERFRINGEEISEDKFSANFWWCFNRLKEETNEDLPMPTFFRFLALLAFKIFAAEQVDVAILEVGLGGQFDATNVVQRPIVCGISSLGFDHMEILGNNLGEIAGQKAGIFKHGVPAFTVPQPDEAMSALEKKASQLDVLLKVAKPLDAHLLNGLQLGLAGEHQYQNAGLAISLCRSWLKKTGHLEGMYLDQAVSLPEQFVKGLVATSFPGRAQIVPDQNVEMDSPGGLVFYLDGAHSPESMDICGRWFSLAIKDDVQHQNSSPEWSQNDSRASHKTSAQVLLFNCMTVRDPLLLLPRLRSICAHNGVHFQKAIFVPNQSVHHKVGSHSSPSTDLQVDLSWQLALQRVWENLVHGDKGGDGRTLGHICQEGTELSKDKIRNGGSSSVFPSLPSAIKWLRDTAQQNRSVRLQVLVTGSLHLIGDLLRLIKR